MRTKWRFWQWNAILCNASCGFWSVNFPKSNKNEARAADNIQDTLVKYNTVDVLVVKMAF